MSMMLVLTLTSFGQRKVRDIEQIDISFGVAVFEPQFSPKVGFNGSGSIGHYYFDISDNLGLGNGNKSNFTSSMIYSNKMSAGVINVGYNINILSSKILFVTPMIGYGYSREIYQSTSYVGYCYRNFHSYINFAVITKVYIKRIGVYVGTGIIDRFKFGLSYRIII